MINRFIAMIMLVAATGLTPVQAEDELVSVAPGVFAFGSAATTLAVVTEAGVVVIDPVNSGQAAALDAALPAVTDQAVTHVLYSHNHWDHISGGQVFKDKGAIVVSHADTKAHLKPNPNVVVPDLTWSGSQYDLVVGGTTIELHHFGPSHGHGMTVFLLPSEKVVFMIDVVTAGRVGFMYMPDFDIDGLAASIDAIEGLDFDIAVFGHGPGSGATKLVGDKSDVTEAGAFLDDLVAGVKGALADGGFQAVSKLDLPKWKKLNMYDQWLGMNATRVMLSLMMGH